MGKDSGVYRSNESAAGRLLDLGAGKFLVVPSIAPTPTCVSKDSDIAIMDMGNGIERLITSAEASHKELLLVDWQCGDGVNMGSFLIKNTEWSRALLERIKDMRLVWQMVSSSAYGLIRLN